MRPDGMVDPPLVEIQHPDTPIRMLPIVELIEFVRNSTLDNAEALLTFIRYAVLLKANPFHEWVIAFPEAERRNKFVRYYRAINMGGTWHILG
jgi:hypothetical protein